MEYMYNMRNTSNTLSHCQLMSCPMFYTQMATMPPCMNYNFQSKQFSGCRSMCGAEPTVMPAYTRNINPYFYQVEMKPVPIEEIED